MNAAERIIYNKLKLVWANYPQVSVLDIDRLAKNAVAEIREEFRKAGVDVWPRWKGGET